MINYDNMLDTIPVGLSKYLNIPVIMGNQAAPAPAHPYGTYNVTTIAGANKGTWQQHDDGVDRKLVRSIWSFSFLSAEWEESVALAIKAREWLEHTGRVWLAEHGITVQSVTEVTNRDSVIGIEYERKNGFDAVFYVYDEAKNPTDTYITRADVTHEMTN